MIRMSSSKELRRRKFFNDFSRAGAFAANTVTSGVQEGVENPTFAAFIERAGHEYAKLSATPKDYAPFSRRSARCGRLSRTGLTRNFSRSARRRW